MARARPPVYALEQAIFKLNKSYLDSLCEITLDIFPAIPKELTNQVLKKANSALPEVLLRVHDGYSIDFLERFQDDILYLAFLHEPRSKYNFDGLEVLSEEIVLISPLGTKKLTQITFMWTKLPFFP